MKTKIDKNGEKFLIKRFKQEWLEIEKEKNRQEFIKKLKNQPKLPLKGQKK